MTGVAADDLELALTGSLCIGILGANLVVGEVLTGVSFLGGADDFPVTGSFAAAAAFEAKVALVEEAAGFAGGKVDLTGEAGGLLEKVDFTGDCGDLFEKVDLTGDGGDLFEKVGLVGVTDLAEEVALPGEVTFGGGDGVIDLPEDDLLLFGIGGLLFLFSLLVSAFEDEA